MQYRKHPKSSIDFDLLASTASATLAADLALRGNVLSTNHRFALDELIDCFTSYCAGRLAGRRGFGLPTGMGKTSAVVAFIGACHRLGYAIPIAVAASKVAALDSIREDLIAHGVSPSLIGLKHGLRESAIVSTGNESRLFQLVTHARVRGGSDFELFGQHQGAPRALMIYDETLWRSDTLHFEVGALRAAIRALSVLLDEATAAPALLAFLQECEDALHAALRDPEVRASHGRGVEVLMPTREGHELDAFARAIGTCRRLPPEWREDLERFIAASTEPLRVLALRDSGLVHCRVVVPEELRNVVVLDASMPMRELVQMDPTITLVEPCSGPDLKRYDAVEVFQLQAGGGRDTVTRGAPALAQETADIVVKEWDRDGGGFLIFTYKTRKVDFEKLLKQALAGKGVDLHAKVQTPNGERDRVRFLTYGDETSLNGFEYCTTVVMAGVLQRSHLDIAAAMKGQQGAPDAATPARRVREVCESEVAHVIYQGASRGSCRKTTNGMAHPMRLYFVHRAKGIASLLAKVMPGARWHVTAPTYLRKAEDDQKATEMADDIAAVLATVSEGSVSSTEVKRLLRLDPEDKAASKLFSRARALFLDIPTSGWKGEGRSFVSNALAYGITPMK